MFPLFLLSPLTNRRGKTSEIITSSHYIRKLQKDQEEIIKTNKSKIKPEQKKRKLKPKQPVKTNKQKRLLSRTESYVDRQEWTCTEKGPRRTKKR